MRFVQIAVVGDSDCHVIYGLGSDGQVWVSKGDEASLMEWVKVRIPEEHMESRRVRRKIESSLGGGR